MSCRESEESIGTEICGARKSYCIGYNKHSGDTFGKSARSPSCALTREHACTQKAVFKAGGVPPPPKKYKTQPALVNISSYKHTLLLLLLHWYNGASPVQDMRDV